MNDHVFILFDIDATLIRTHGAGMRAMARAFKEEMGWDHVFETVIPAGRTDTGIANELSLKHRQKEMLPEEMDNVFGKYLEYLKIELYKSTAFEVLPGIKTFLENWSDHDRVVMGLGTGNLEAGAKIKLEHAKIDHYFVFGGYGSDSPIRNNVLEIAVERGEGLFGKKVKRERVIVIGDTHHDILAGKAIGAKTIAVATGPFKVDELSIYKPDMAIASFKKDQLVNEFIGKILNKNS